MARKQRNTIDYFPHTAHKNKALLFIKQKYGHTGIAFYWELFERLARTENHFINLSDEIESEMFSMEIDIDKDQISSMIRTLIKLGVIDKLLWETDKIVWAQSFIDDISDLYIKKRHRPAPERPDSKVELNDNKVELNDNKVELNGERMALKSNFIPQSKVKESKVNKSKIKESRSDFSGNNFPMTEKELDTFFDE